MTIDENRIVQTYVAPLYLSADTVLIAEAARSAAVDVVLWMIDNAGWREQRVGAYLAVVRTEPQVAAALLAAIPRTHGTLSLHALVASAVLLAGTDAIAPLHAHQQRVNAVGYLGDPGSGFAGAALEHLGEHPQFAATDDDRKLFERMLQIAEQIRSA